MTGVDERTNAAPERRSALPLAIWLVAGVAVLVRLTVALTTHFTSEDFLITLRYAENLASGNGLVYNVGERVLGTTTPLYTLFLASLSWVGLPAALVGKLLGIAADGLLCLVLFRWLNDRGFRTAGLFAALFMALNPIQIRWAISGMETSLVTLCGVWIWYELDRRRTKWAFAALGVLFMLRWDSVLILLVATAAVVFTERRLPFRELALYAVIIAPWIAFAWTYYGNPIPVTGHAKMVVYGWRFREQLLPGLPALGYHLVGTTLYLISTASAVLGLTRIYRERLSWIVLPLLWFALYWSAFLWSKVLLFEWYIPPVLPIYAVTMALGLDMLWRRLPYSPGRAAGQTLAWVAVGTGAVSVTLLMISVIGETQRIEDHLRIPVGKYLASVVPPDSQVMMEPIGYIGYYSHCKILDAIGLVSPEVLPCYSRAARAPFLDIARRFLPGWVLLRPGELQHILDADGTWWKSHYRLHKTFTYTPRPTREPITFFLFQRSFNIAR